MNSNILRCYICGSSTLGTVSVITKRPEKETDFGISADSYHREIRCCSKCGVYNNFHCHCFEDLYSEKYNADTYGGELLPKYERIMALPFERSDNKNRVKRILSVFSSESKSLAGAEVLDIGSGLCVFLAELMKYGVRGYCVDPDRMATEHALRNVGVKGACTSSFSEYHSDVKFDLIAFNKVLEHVKNPVPLLEKAKSYLKPGGFVYIELPDGDSALKADELTNREEFYIEHYTIFNIQSLRYLINVAGLKAVAMESIIEPSGKYTLCAFGTKK